MKHDFNHWRTMGFQMEDVIDPDGAIVDIMVWLSLSIVIEVHLTQSKMYASFIIDLLDEQKKGNLPYDLFFIWDSVGSIPCQMSIEKGSNSPLWNGGLKTQFLN